jgi:glycosyltransferase involved in cell wall biosynthesis
MELSEPFRVGFVVKRYPRYSETFIVREILAHEEAGLDLEIFSLRPSNDAHFQDIISRVRSRVNFLYLPADGLSERLPGTTLTAAHLWQALCQASEVLPDVWTALAEAGNAEARDIYLALHLALHVRLKKIQHLHATFASDAATVARLAARFADVPYSVTARAKDIFHQSADREDLQRKFRDAAGIITISDYHVQFLRDTFGAVVDRVQRIYNGLDLTEFPFSPPDHRPAVILAVGRLVPKKGFADLISACALLADKDRQFQCRIIGAGPLATELQAQIDRLGLQARVALVGPVPQPAIIEEMRNAAVLAAPCIVDEEGDRDGLPNVIQEALALGTPVVATDVAGIPEVVRHGETGLQVSQSDPQALAAAIEQLLLNQVLREKLATGGRRLMEAEFDIRRNTQKRRAVFQGTPARPSASAYAPAGAASARAGVSERVAAEVVQGVV